MQLIVHRFHPKRAVLITFSMWLSFRILHINFIVFDIEIVLLIPIKTVIVTRILNTILLISVSFLLILSACLIHQPHPSHSTLSRILPFFSVLSSQFALTLFCSTISSYSPPFPFLLLRYVPLQPSPVSL